MWIEVLAVSGIDSLQAHRLGSDGLAEASTMLSMNAGTIFDWP
jgi:hypothetical protein